MSIETVETVNMLTAYIQESDQIKEDQSEMILKLLAKLDEKDLELNKARKELKEKEASIEDDRESIKSDRESIKSISRLQKIMQKCILADKAAKSDSNEILISGFKLLEIKVESLKAENDALKVENDSLKTEKKARELVENHFASA